MFMQKPFAFAGFLDSLLLTVLCSCSFNSPCLIFIAGLSFVQYKALALIMRNKNIEKCFFYECALAVFSKVITVGLPLFALIWAAAILLTLGVDLDTITLTAFTCLLSTATSFKYLYKNYLDTPYTGSLAKIDNKSVIIRMRWNVPKSCKEKALKGEKVEEFF
jgi:hypothetical protein